MSRKPPALPDLDDDAAFRRKLSPLVESVLPVDRQTGYPEVRTYAYPDDRKPDGPDIRAEEYSLTQEPDKPEIRRTDHPSTQSNGLPGGSSTVSPDKHTIGYPSFRLNALPDNRTSDRVEAAEAQARVEAARGEKRRFEYLIPKRVGRALAEDAAAQGKSATTLLLEVLRNAGYPVIPEDLVDLRKMPKR